MPGQADSEAGASRPVVDQVSSSLSDLDVTFPRPVGKTVLQELQRQMSTIKAPLPSGKQIKGLCQVETLTPRLPSRLLCEVEPDMLQETTSLSELEASSSSSPPKRRVGSRLADVEELGLPGAALARKADTEDKSGIDEEDWVDRLGGTLSNTWQSMENNFITLVSRKHSDI